MTRRDGDGPTTHRLPPMPPTTQRILHLGATPPKPKEVEIKLEAEEPPPSPIAPPPPPGPPASSTRGAGAVEEDDDEENSEDDESEANEEDENEDDDEDEPRSPLLDRFPALRRIGQAFAKRVKPIHQTHASECGAACLAMVMGYFGKEVRLAEVRELMGVGRDGASAINILKTARWHGLRGRAVKLEDLEEDLPYLPGPSILHWEFNHFVVFERYLGDAVDIVDPGHGPRRMPMSRFRKSFTGVALTFEPTKKFAPAKLSRNQIVDQFRRTLKSGASGLVRIIVTSLLLQVLALAVPILTGVMIDRVIPKQDHHLLLVLGVGLAGLVFFFFLASIVRSLLLLQLRTVLDSQMTLGFLEHLVDLPYSFFQSRPTGDLVNRLNSNANIREILTSAAVSGIFDGSMVVLYLLVLFLASPPMALLVLVLGALQVILFLVTRRAQRDLIALSLDAQVKSQSYLIEVLAGIETLKSSGNEQRALDHWSDLFVDELNVNIERGKLNGLLDSLLSALKIGAPLAILVFGGVRAMRGDFSIGSMLAINALGAAFLVPLSALVASLGQFQLLGTYLDRINDVLDTPAEQEIDKTIAPGRLRGNITIDRVSFRHGPMAPMVVREVSVTVKAGRSVAIVGASGSGKSTLARLLVGLYRPTSGRILYDNVDLAQMDARSVRAQLGIVTQNTYLFGRSVRRNIALGNAEVPFSRIVEASKLACIHDEIVTMPMGYETLLSDGGSSMSGGQRQRIALARALVNRPSILLLDEATSALDSVTESTVKESLDGLGCTRIVIAHRLSTIVNADLILVMDQGDLVEQGTHDELMKLGGHYAALVAAQVKPKAIDPDLQVGPYGGPRGPERLIIRSVRLSADPPTVWKALTDPKRVAAWMSAQSATVELMLGGRFEVYWKGIGRSTAGSKILALTPEKLLIIEWKGSEQHPVMNTSTHLTNVTFVLSTAAGKTELQMIHSGFGHGKEWDAALFYCESAWEIFLGGLKTHLGSAG